MKEFIVQAILVLLFVGMVFIVKAILEAGGTI